MFNKKDTSINQDKIILDEINPGVEISTERPLYNSLLSDSSMTIITDAEPFYPVQRTIEEIVDEVENLKARVIEYESRILISQL